MFRSKNLINNLDCPQERFGGKKRLTIIREVQRNGLKKMKKEIQPKNRKRWADRSPKLHMFDKREREREAQLQADRRGLLL